MNAAFIQNIDSFARSGIAADAVGGRFLERAKEGAFTRDESPISHYCVYFLPYDPKTKRLFIVHHKKSGLWISPGGHIDKGESFMQALNREIGEELGTRERVREQIDPFLLTITLMDNPKHSCKEHLDVWYRFPTDGSEFNVDPKEFHETRWVTISAARELVTDKANIEMLDRMAELFGRD